MAKQGNELFTISPEESNPGSFRGRIKGVIPPFPEESEIAVRRAEGSPKKLYESAILVHEVTQKEVSAAVLAQGAEFINAFIDAKLDSQRDKVGRRVCSYLITQPAKIEDLYTYFYATQELAYLAEDTNLQNQLESMLLTVKKELKEKAQSVKTPLVEANAQVLLAGASSEATTKELYEDILYGFLHREDAPEGVVANFYTLAKAALDTGDDTKIEYVLKVFGGDTEVLNENDGLVEKVIAGMFSSDDATLKKAHELDIFNSSLGLVYFDDAINARHTQRVFTAMSSAYVLHYITQMQTQHPDRVSAVLQFAQGPAGVGPGDFAVISDEDLETFPYNIVFKNQGPVLNMTNEIQHRFVGDELKQEGLRMVHIPGKGSVHYGSAVSLKDIFIDALSHRDASDVPELTGAYAADAITYLSPEFSNVKEVKELFDLNRALSKEIYMDKERLISQRGVSVEVTDENLKKLGLKNILFTRTPRNESRAQSGAVTATINIGEYYVNLVVGENGTIEWEDVNATNNARLWFSAVVLSHLCEVICTKEDVLDAQGGSHELIADIQRVAHRRLLPSGHVAQPQQLMLAAAQGWGHLQAVNEHILLDSLGAAGYATNLERLEYLDLVKLCRDRGIISDIQLYTYVSEVPINPELLASRGPVRVVSKTALDRMNAVFEVV